MDRARPRHWPRQQKEALDYLLYKHRCNQVTATQLHLQVHFYSQEHPGVCLKLGMSLNVFKNRQSLIEASIFLLK